MTTPMSLRQDPLVSQMLADRRVRLVPRAVDSRWVYEGHLPHLMTGFNPDRLEVYYGAGSRLADWLAHRDSADDRRFNAGDWLVRELFLAVHDYFHGWATLAIDFALRVAGPRAWTFEDRVFTHLLTEVAATVAVDYWHLCTFDLSSRYDLGSRLRAYSTSYHEDDLAEYRRFNLTLEIQSPGFFTTLARFYCDGRLGLLPELAFDRSPRAAAWLEHELVYAKQQRRYAREWVAHLHGAKLKTAALDQELAWDTPWKRTLIAKLGEMTWDKVKQGLDAVPAEHALSKSPATARRAKARDYRMTDIGPLAELELPADDVNGESFTFLKWQIVSRLDHARCDLMLAERLLGATPAQLRALLKKARREPQIASELEVPGGGPMFFPG